jgi:predicted alpha-1,6-mannanase (GH76 family)
MLGGVLVLLSLVLLEVKSDLAIDSFNNAFYVINNGVGYYVVDSVARAKPDKGQFWRVCEQIEMIEDAYEKTGSTIYKNMIGELINGLNQVVSGTEDWASWNIYNDDIMWGVIALVRSYRLTGNTAHLGQAEQQFNAVWSRGWDSANGGLYWNTQKQSKNACVNGPASIAGFLLGESTTGTGYKNQAMQAFNWLHEKLYNNSTGQVADHINNDGSLVWWAFTYNQGTFLGAATLYAKETGDQSKIQLAKQAAQWSQQHLTGQHLPNILNDEDDSADGDGVGFKGILARWAKFYVNETGDSSIQNWLNQNAQTAWSFRNSKGVTWTQWWHRTPDDSYTSWGCTSTACIMSACTNCNESDDKKEHLIQ